MPKSTFIRLLFGLVLIGLLLFPLPASAAQNLKVYYAGPQGGISQALALDRQVEFVSDLAQADVIVLNGVIPETEAIRQRVKAGAGLVLALGPDLTANQVGALLGETVRLEQKDNPLSLSSVNASDNPLVKEIVWTSSPQVRERFLVDTPGFAPLVEGFEDHSLVLGEK